MRQTKISLFPNNKLRLIIAFALHKKKNKYKFTSINCIAR